MKTFELLHKDSNTNARLGVLRCAHGQVETPAFMPVGTAGAVKGLTAEQLQKCGAQMILANTYHLFLRPGVEVVEQLGGLHNLMAWKKPILTDSGGYQIFSLNSLTNLSDDGVEFASHIDGRKIYLTPELATNIQNKLGSDVAMCLDECVSLPCDRQRAAEAAARTLRWAVRCREVHDNKDQLLFAITQGGTEKDLRQKCSEELLKFDFDGYAIGGLGVGETRDSLLATVEACTEVLPQDKPRYLMGIGMPSDIIAAVRRGVDMFDCVIPTRNGRNAFAFTTAGPVRLRNACHTDSTDPIADDCDCYTCRNYSRGALRHFFNVSEMLGPILTSLHNVHFFQRLMAEIRHKIKTGDFESDCNGTAF